jgi:hypothetical protein
MSHRADHRPEGRARGSSVVRERRHRHRAEQPCRRRGEPERRTRHVGDVERLMRVAALPRAQATLRCASAAGIDTLPALPSSGCRLRRRVSAGRRRPPERYDDHSAVLAGSGADRDGGAQHQLVRAFPPLAQQVAQPARDHGEQQVVGRDAVLVRDGRQRGQCRTTASCRPVPIGPVREVAAAWLPASAAKARKVRNRCGRPDNRRMLMACVRLGRLSRTSPSAVGVGAGRRGLIGSTPRSLSATT